MWRNPAPYPLRGKVRGKLAYAYVHPATIICAVIYTREENKYNADDAGVAKLLFSYLQVVGVWRNWYTRTLQERMDASPCGFKSHHAHHLERNASRTNLCMNDRDGMMIAVRRLRLTFPQLENGETPRLVRDWSQESGSSSSHSTGCPVA